MYYIVVLLINTPFLLFDSVLPDGPGLRKPAIVFRREIMPGFFRRLIQNLRILAQFLEGFKQFLALILDKIAQKPPIRWRFSVRSHPINVLQSIHIR